MKLSKKNELLIEIFGVILAVCAGLITAEIVSPFDNAIDHLFNPKKYQYAHFVIAFLMVFIVTVLYFLTKKFLTKENNLINKQSFEERQFLIESLRRRYSERLHKKMDDDLKLTIQLQLNYTKEGTDEAFADEYFVIDYEETSAGDFETLFNNYEQNLSRLLVIGDPGSGKTTLLLEFAEKLLSIAESNPLYPIPLILNLSSWRNEYETFKSWLQENLYYHAGEFGTSRENAKNLAQSHNLILLLDGLDEIPDDHRGSCLLRLKSYLSIINKKRDVSYPELIISCRREEYREIQINAPIQASVSIEPINPLDIEKALDRIKQYNKVIASPAYDLEKIIQLFPDFKFLLTTAFHLHIALTLADDKNNFRSIRTQNELVHLYTQKEIKKVNIYYEDSVTENTLVWLSKKCLNLGKE